MLRPREQKRHFCKEKHCYEYQNVYGSGLFSSMKTFGKKLLGQTAKKAAKKAATEATSSVIDSLSKKFEKQPTGGQDIVRLLK